MGEGAARLGPVLPRLASPGQRRSAAFRSVACPGGSGACVSSPPVSARRWYKLHSKPGKKEKDRGEVQLSIQFTRHSLTASMFDLSVKEKPRSPFGRLKDKVTGRQKYDLESASAIVPSSSGALDEELGPAGKKAKAKSFFFRSKLRKSSLTQSNTSLGSDSTASSASSVAPGGMPQSPSRHSSLSTDPSARDFLPSPKLTHKRAFSDEASQIGLLPDARRAQGLTPQSEPVSRSSLCINGSHIYCEEPAPGPPASPRPRAAPTGPARPLSPGRVSPSRTCHPGPAAAPAASRRAPPRDPPRFIPSPPILAAQEEDKLSVKTIALNRQRGWAKAAEGPGAQSRPVQIAAPLVFSAEVRRVRPRGGGQEEEEDEAQRGGAGSLRRASGRDSGESGGAAHEGPAEAAAGEEEGHAGAGLRPGSPDSEEPARVPSPHPVKPLSSSSSAPGPAVSSQEKLQRTTPDRSGGTQETHTPSATSSRDSASPAWQLGRPEAKKEPSAPDPSAKYFHLTHDELIQLLSKREAELRGKQEHIQELENYIDRLLVRIMEQSPTLLQIPLGGEAKAAK
ncbi:LOW QUALITY PROTEIN: rab11 family-interacting protein 5 [Varanus komodoensis]|uniref:LOW QUALITY PROTEIN: rab11 family-interacting protein 5 n=1 Tax=Varanus komodoensis TaxID=61221 RepID=UPI001CF785F4|nr:LOW QUALITY PROTEIN: rab11 family-interacting protein 5 [Varanus komodoensis]